MSVSSLGSLVPLPERIKASGLPAFLYGMGDGADRIYAYLDANGISVSGVVASEGFLRGQSFRGFGVTGIADAEKQYGRLCLVLCFGLSGEKTEILGKISEKHLLVSPNLPVIGDGICDREYILGSAPTLDRIYDSLADGPSRDIFVSLLKYDITGDISYLSFGAEAEEAPEGFWSRRGLHIDVGAYDGDTVREYIAKKPINDGIAAFEPDRASFRRLVSAFGGKEGITLVNACVGDKSGAVSFSDGKGRGSHSGGEREIPMVSIDDYCLHKNLSPGGMTVGSIKIDAEGMDESVLCGAANTLYLCKSNICVSLYHRAHDIVDIPLLLMRYGLGYKFYIRKKEYVPAWDTMLFALAQ